MRTITNEIIIFIEVFSERKKSQKNGEAQIMIPNI